MALKRIHLSFFIMTVFFCSTSFPQSVHRYTEPLFQSVRTTADQVYATAQALNNPYTGEIATHSEDLTLDIYQPQGDTLSLRPVLICAHGGGFIQGSKDHDDMVAFCDSLAKKGYVTVTINYRQGMNVLSSVSAARAVYRGLQDSRAVIRYIKSVASALRIDTNYVFFLGSSAGAFMALQNVYMNKESERPAATYKVSHIPPTLDDGPDLGDLDAINSSLKFGSQPNAIIALWGAVGDTTLIEPADADIHALLVHGTADNIVPFNVGSPFGASNLPPTYGSYPINVRLKNLGKPAETYFVNGAGHEFYGVTNGSWSPEPNAYWDTVLTLVTNFLHDQHKPDAKFSTSINGKTVQFNNQTSGSVSWFWNFGDGSTSTEENPKHIYSSNGTYNVTLTALNQIESWDTVSSPVVVSGATGISDKNNSAPLTFSLSQNFPNPFNPSTIIVYQIQGTDYVTLKVYDLMGREVATLVNEYKQPGIYEVKFNGSNLPSGIYIYKLTAGNFNASKKLILLK